MEVPNYSIENETESFWGRYEWLQIQQQRSFLAAQAAIEKIAVQLPRNTQ